MHCEAIRKLEHARGYLFSLYGGTEAAMLITRALRILVPTEFVCGTCGGRHK
jgi:hypothetical protein